MFISNLFYLGCYQKRLLPKGLIVKIQPILMITTSFSNTQLLWN